MTMPLTNAIFIILVFGLIWSIYRLHRNPDIDFNILDLVMENGRVSKVSCLVMGAFTLHSWIMIDLQATAKMTEGYLTIYGATWVAPLITRLVMTAGAPTPHKEQT
jgi:hypothetical protein